MSSSSSSAKVCFNSNCKVLLSQSRKGWRRRTGEFADLCDRCASVYEEGKFCETFHVNASGWRSCESCGKQIHCGCIVSFHMFVLLDAGGIECLTCARKSFILTPNPAWPPPSLSLPVQPERIKELSVKNWSSMVGSGPVPWRQAPGLFNGSAIQSELQPRMPFGVDISGGIDKLRISERISVSSLENKKKEDSYGKLVNGSLKSGASDVSENGNAGINCEAQPYPSVNISQLSSFSKNDPRPNFSLGLPSSSRNETNDQTKISETPTQRTTHPPSVEKNSCSNGMDSSAEAQIRNGRPRGDSRGRSQLLPRYWPRTTQQELLQLSADSNSIITPLFEKMLSASDAGRIGRLVLPKKCAEAYFPPISHPEGLPLKVQDLKGREWVFQFRFWPNNNSRMYVLEGVTPCIQSMQLQAGDIVTFSRVEPEGKLLMGCRKAIAAPSHQGNEAVNTGNGVSTLGDVSTVNSADPTSTFSEVDKSGYIAKEVLEGKPSSRIKRKNSTLGSKCKRLKIGNEDMIELKLTVEQAQGLFRSPPNHVPTIVVIEDIEFEEYEDAPVIGRPTIPATDHAGEKIQWAQCEDCLKWRKVPPSALLPSRWTCSGNSWDPDRSLCSVAQELTSEQLQDLLPTIKAASKKMKAHKQDEDSVDTMEGLDTLANLAIQEEGEDPSSSQATTKHPRHRPGCTCIVCIQPPSGKGHKHRQSCNCNVCATVNRRFNTLLLKRGKKKSEKEAEAARQKLQQEQQQLPEQILDDDIQQSDTGNSTPNQEVVSNEGSENDPNTKKASSSSPFKGKIDLNIQPERDEEFSPSSDSGGVMTLLQDATERYLRQQRFSSSISNGNSAGNQTWQDGIERQNFSNIIALDSSHPNTEANHQTTLSVNSPASTSTSER